MYTNKTRKYEHLDARGRLWHFRSTWELKFAQYLDERELTWDYEPHRLLLSDGRVYIPDFWVHEWNVYCEIKGWRGSPNADKAAVNTADGRRTVMIGDITQGDAALHVALTQTATTLKEG